MPPPDPPTSIQLKVKVPPGYLSSTDEFPLGSLETTSTIASLRQQIQQLVPTHPAPERQRLLYGGRALVDNEQTIADALNTKRDPIQTEYVIHLLVKGEQGATSSGTAGSGQHRRSTSQPASRARAQQDGQNQHQHQHQHQQQQNPGLQTPQGQTPANAQHIPQRLQHAHQPEALRQLQMQQQMWLQQMAMAQMNGARMQNFQQQPMPGLQAPHGWPQMVAGNQQMRAGMGMQGIGGQQAVGQDQQHSTPATTEGQNQEQAQPPQQQQAPQNQDQGQQQQRTDSAPPAPGNAQNQQQEQQGQGQRRPISGQGFHLEGVGPNGQRFQISQHTLNIPHAGMGAGMGMPMIPQLPGMIPGMAPQMPFPPPPAPQQQQQQNGPSSALDRARENMMEMRRLLDDMRNQPHETAELRAQIGEVQARVQSLNAYIDPFHLGNAGAGGNAATAGRQSTSPRPQGAAAPGLPGPPPRLPQGLRIQRQQAIPTFPGLMPQQQMQMQPSSNPNEVTAYLLSSPQGPQALLFSPEHGTYTGTLTQQPIATGLRPTSTVLQHGSGVQRDPAQAPPHIPAPNADPAQRPQDPAAAVPAAQQQNGAAAQDPLGPMQPILAHFWLLLRILIFAYFVLGSNMGWQRPMILMAIGLGFLALRAGFLGDGGAVRRWWEGVVGVPGRRQDQQGVVQGQGQQNLPPAVGGAPAQQQQPAVAQGQIANANANPPQQQQQQQRRLPMPTPEQVAQRLLNQEDAARNQRRTWLRERIRPVERAVALFVASLWPGIGEAHVRAREEEQRRLAEEEIGRRRQEEEVREREKEKKEGSEEKGQEAGSVAPKEPGGENAGEGTASTADVKASGASGGGS